MVRSIKKVAVLGSGVMGSRIACHFANAGLEVLLLDIVPQQMSDAVRAKGLSPEDPSFRNSIVNSALQAVIKSTPAPLFDPATASRIITGNFEDNMADIASADWVLEAVVENLDIKRQVLERVDHHRRAGTLLTTNTSGIPIHLLIEGRSEDFIRHFCGTHFFNPPRYLRLLEIIPTEHTDPDVTAFLMDYGDRFLGKTTVRCKDTPAFIANRIGVFSIMAVFRLMEQLHFTIDEIDALTGPIIGHPKSATFRTGDVVGIDTLVKVARDLITNCPEDEAREMFQVPEFVEKLVASGRLGDKTGAGFYKKEKTASGSKIFTLNPATMEYEPKSKPRFQVFEIAKPVEDLRQRMPLLYQAEGKAGQFYQKFHGMLFSYVANRIPEIATELYKIDDAMKAGFGWELGPFETWDSLGVKATLDAMKSEGFQVPEWVETMLASGREHFYRIENGKRFYYDQVDKAYKPVAGGDGILLLDNFSKNIVWHNTACKLYDIGDGVICLSWKTKMNTIGVEVLEGLNTAIGVAEKDFAGLVIANEGAVFSAGANVGLIFMLAAEQEWDELHQAIRTFQKASMRIRYSSIPVVAAPMGLTLGGGCEICLHADQVQASAETYFGLVEMGVGLIPAGGGTKEFTLRAGEAYRKGEIELPILRPRFMTIGTAKVSGSADEAYEMGMLRKGYDRVTMNPSRVIAEAKARVREMATAGYVIPARKKVKVLGREVLGALLTGIHSMWLANHISEYDRKIAGKLAWVMSGGDLSAPTEVTEEYLLDLEREAFVSLCGEQKTLERLQSVLKTGKPVRN